MSTRTDFKIKTSESFFNLPDTSNVAVQKFTITNENWIGQVFISKSSELQKFFFLCNDTEGLEVFIHKADVSTSNGRTIYTPNQIVVSIIHEVDGLSPFQVIEKDNPDSVASWNYPNWLATPQTANDQEEPYIVVFKTTSDKKPEVYYTFEYRQPIFPQIIGWNGEAWSNNNISTKTVNKTQIGAVCFGFIGNNLREHDLDLGSLIVGGRDTARRGYPVFIFAENISSQNDNIILDFSTVSPEDSSLGTPEETSKSMMKWYRFNRNTLPTSKNLELLDAEFKTELNAENNFVLFIHPDKLSPFADTYLPPSDIEMISNKIGVVPIYDSGETNNRFATDFTNRFQKKFWAKFSKDTILDPIISTITTSEKDLDEKSLSGFLNGNFANGTTSWLTSGSTIVSETGTGNFLTGNGITNSKSIKFNHPSSGASFGSQSHPSFFQSITTQNLESQITGNSVYDSITPADELENPSDPDGDGTSGRLHYVYYVKRSMTGFAATENGITRLAFVKQNGQSYIEIVPNYEEILPEGETVPTTISPLDGYEYSDTQGWVRISGYFNLRTGGSYTIDFSPTGAYINGTSYFVIRPTIPASTQEVFVDEVSLTYFDATQITQTDDIITGRNASGSRNPDYIDFSFENPNGEVDIVKKLTLSSDILDGSLTEKELVRGFDKVVFYKGKYVFFSKKTIDGLLVSSPASIPATPGKLVVYVADSDLTNFQKKTVQLLDSSPSTLGIGTGGTEKTYIIGLNDTIVTNVSGEETILFLTKTFVALGVSPISYPSQFDIGYYQGDLSESTINIQLINHESTGALDLSSTPIDRYFGSFAHLDSRILSDDKNNAIFISPNNLNNIYISASSDNCSQNKFVGLGLWKIDLNDSLSSIYEAERLKPNFEIQAIDINLGTLNTAQTGISSFRDSRITFVLYDGNTTYLGVRGRTLWTQPLSVNVLSEQNTCRIYRTVDFVTFEQLLGNEPIYSSGNLPSWLAEFSSIEDLFTTSGLGDEIINNDVKFMYKVGNILHAWICPHFFDEKNTPMHIGIDTNNKLISVLRKFPIENVGDSNYEISPKVSDLELYPRSKALRWIEDGSVNGNYIYICGADTLSSNTENPTQDIININDNVPVCHSYPDSYSARWIMYDDRIINKPFVSDINNRKFFMFIPNSTSLIAIGVGRDSAELVKDYPSITSTYADLAVKLNSDVGYYKENPPVNKIKILDMRDGTNITVINNTGISGGENFGTINNGIFVTNNNVYITKGSDFRIYTSASILNPNSSVFGSVSISSPFGKKFFGTVSVFEPNIAVGIIVDLATGFLSSLVLINISNKAFPSAIQYLPNLPFGESYLSLDFSDTGNTLYAAGRNVSGNFIDIFDVSSSMLNFVTRLQTGSTFFFTDRIKVQRGKNKIIYNISNVVFVYDISAELNPILMDSIGFLANIAFISFLNGGHPESDEIDDIIFVVLTNGEINALDISNISIDGIVTLYNKKILNSVVPFTHFSDIGSSIKIREGFETIRGKGIYNGKTVIKFDHDEKSSTFKKYPALFPDDSTVETKPRVGMYCGLVSYGSDENIGIENDTNNIISKLFSYGGINYISVNNENSGFNLYKTYGIKELPQNWGNSYRDIEGNLADINTYYSLDIDKAAFENVFFGKETFKNISRISETINSNNTYFISELKTNNLSSNFIDIDTDNPERNLVFLNLNYKKPQHISMFYNLNYFGDGSDILDLSDTNTSETELTFTSAQTLEKLFTDPDQIITIPLAQEVSNDPSNRTFIRKTLPADISSNFFRIESSSVYDNEANGINVYIKSLSVNDVSLSFPDSETAIKTVVVNGIVYGTSQSPENIIENDAILPPDGEIIIDFTKPIYINEINFKAKYSSPDFKGVGRAEFEFLAITNIEKESTGNDLVSSKDWISLGNSVFYGNLNNESEISKKNILSYIQSIRIILKSSISITIKELSIRGFSSGLLNQFVSSGDIKSQELILVDDIFGLLEANNGSVAGAFASFESNNSSLEFDLGQTVPITRITMNVAGEEETNTRTLQVDTWDGTTLSEGNPQFDNVFTGSVPNYGFSLVRWKARPKERSREVEVEFLDSSAPYTPDPLLNDLELGDFLLDFNNISNNSGLLLRSGLSGWSFRPSVFKDRSISVSSSEGRFESGDDEDYVDENTDGFIVVNAQMDEGGPFKDDGTGNAIGLLENKLSIDFSARDVRKIKITLRNQLFGGSSLKINGLRVYTPIVDSLGMAIFPVSMPELTIRFKINVSTEK